MFIYNQIGNISVKAERISRFHVDENHNIFSYCADSDETLLLGSYSTADKAMDALVAVIDAIEAGKTYRMPIDEAAEVSVEPAEAIQPDEPDVVEPTDTMDDVPTAHGKHRGRAPSGKFSLFCGLYPDYLRGECGVTSMAREIGCSTATVYTYLRKMRALVDAAAAADSE